MVRQIAHIIVPPREKRSATFRVFTAETTPEEEATRGLLFGCFVIDYYHHRNEEILDSITEELQSRYYDPDISTQQPEDLFEETLQSLNTTLAQLIENEQIFLNLKRFHAVIGVIRGKALTFTHLGDFRVYLLHQNIAHDQHFIDLLTTTDGASEAKSPPITRIFSHVVSGGLRTSDVVLFATSSLFDYSTKERLQKIVASLPPPRAVEQIKTMIKGGEKNTVGVLSLLLRLAPPHEAPLRESAKESLTTLQTTEDDTRRYLAPSLLRTTVKHAKTILQFVEMGIRKLLRIPSSAPRSEAALRVLRGLLAILRIIGRAFVFCKRFLVTCYSIIKDLVRERSGWQNAFTRLKEQSKEGMAPLLQKGKHRFTGLGLRQRVLVIAAGILAIVVLVSTVTLTMQRSRSLALQEYEKNISLIKERIATAEASLLFKDEERTKSIYSEALQLVTTLPRKSKAEQETQNELKKEIEQHLAKLQHVLPLSRVDVVKDFLELDPAVEVQALTIIDNNAYVAHGSRPLLYKVNLDNKQALTLDASGVDVRAIKHLAPEEKDPILYIVFDASGIAGVNLAKQSIAQSDITFGASGTTIDGIGMYNKRLYLVDLAHNQIWRHDKKDGGFGKGTSWLKTPLDLSGTRAFAIDGALWIAKQNEVIRLLQGKQTNWKLDTFDPPALSIRSVIAQNGSNKLWLLDEAGKRVLAVEKDTGKLIAQYPLPADDIRDFSVNEKTGQILLLTKTKLLALEYEK
ncbi:MAG: hypothetical protein Q7S16_05055 [bacterium]|nr:hypothetical protein [bacterium]